MVKKKLEEWGNDVRIGMEEGMKKKKKNKKRREKGGKKVVEEKDGKYKYQS